MNENKVPETGTEIPTVPRVDVKIYLPKDADKDHGKLLGFASVNLGGVFAVNGIRIYNADKGPYIAMPGAKGRDKKHHDVCCPTTKEMRQALNEAVLNAYQKEVERPSVRIAIKENTRETASQPAPGQQAKRTADKEAR